MGKQRQRNKVIVLCVIILIALFLFFLFVMKEIRQSQKTSAVGKTTVTGNDILSKHVTDSAAYAHKSIAAIVDSVRDIGKQQKISIIQKRKNGHGIPVHSGTVVTDRFLDSTFDEIIAADMARNPPKPFAGEIKYGLPCESDTEAPWVYPDPSGGLHRKEISITLHATKTCVIEWRTDSVSKWHSYKGESIDIKKTLSLHLRAHDTCGNVMPEREEYYEIKPQEKNRFCPDGMEYVSVGATRYCIDKYEWPDKAGALPQAYISIYNSMDSCVSLGKHLCTTDEWTLACTGPYGWSYPYGASYEPHACNTQDTSARAAGSKVECRGYFEVFDMAGNLAEWTSTKSVKNPQFFNVKGGFWESGSKSGCFDIRYSYFPQNRHNPVGFRCCKEAARE